MANNDVSFIRTLPVNPIQEIGSISTQWRSLVFFDLRPDADEGKLDAALRGAEIASGTCGNGRIIICDSFGLVHLFDRNWSAKTFRAYGPNPFMMCELIASCNCLVTVGYESSDNGSLSPTLKCWNLNKPMAANTTSTEEIVFQSERKSVLLNNPVCLSVADNARGVAVGYPDGIFQLFRGDVRGTRSKDAEKLQCGTATVVGMAFGGGHKWTTDPNKDMQHLFVCTTELVAVFAFSDKDLVVMTVLERKCDSANRCCVMQRETPPSLSRSATNTEGLFMVGQDKVGLDMFAMLNTRNIVNFFWFSHLTGCLLLQ